MTTTTDAHTFTGEGRAILRCRDCGHTGTREFTTTTTLTVFNGGPSYSTVLTTTDDGKIYYPRLTGDTKRILHTRCTGCDSRHVSVNIVAGTLVESKPCDGRCMSARRASCECSCGGQNHGGAHGAW